MAWVESHMGMGAVWVRLSPKPHRVTVRRLPKHFVKGTCLLYEGKSQAASAQCSDASVHGFEITGASDRAERGESCSVMRRVSREP